MVAALCGRRRCAALAAAGSSAGFRRIVSRVAGGVPGVGLGFCQVHRHVELPAETPGTDPRSSVNWSPLGDEKPFFDRDICAGQIDHEARRMI